MKLRKRATLMLAALILLVSTTEIARADLVVNGGFETGDFTNWTTSSNFDSFTTFVTTNVDGYVPNSGSYFAALGAVNSDQTLSQNLATTVGQTYQLSFALASNGSPNNFSATLSSTVNGIVSTQTAYPVNSVPATPFNSATATYTYTNITYDFTANATSTTLQFSFQDYPAYLALDSVSVNAIPEPSGFALITISVVCLAIGYALLRRKLAPV